jgi:hypothetical protein
MKFASHFSFCFRQNRLICTEHRNTATGKDPNLGIVIL